jgi:hypothetical protein
MVGSSEKWNDILTMLQSYRDNIAITSRYLRLDPLTENKHSDNSTPETSKLYSKHVMKMFRRRCKDVTEMLVVEMSNGCRMVVEWLFKHCPNIVQTGCEVVRDGDLMSAASSCLIGREAG